MKRISDLNFSFRSGRTKQNKTTYSQLSNDPNANSLRHLPWSAPLMVRNLNGEIYYWNSIAEKRYGWSHRQALGNVSHELLETVFPEPLDLINNELITRGLWKGELIHTRSDGTKVKVFSTWELYKDSEGRLCTVLEINENFSPLNPQTAYLKSSDNNKLKLIREFLLKRKFWLITPILVGALLLSLLIAFTHSAPHISAH